MKRIKQLQAILEVEKDVTEIVLSHVQASELLNEVKQLQEDLKEYIRVESVMDGHLVRNGKEIIKLTNEKADLESQLHVANQQLNSIRCYMEMPVPRDELEPAILAVLDDPNHDGI